MTVGVLWKHLRAQEQSAFFAGALRQVEAARGVREVVEARLPDHQGWALKGCHTFTSPLQVLNTKALKRDNNPFPVQCLSSKEEVVYKEMRP